MGFIYADVPITDLLLDGRNPRFASSNIAGNTGISQDRIIKHLLKHANIADLAKRIRQVGYLHPAENVVCCKENNQYIVLEGNRRICACKLLLDARLVPAGVTANFAALNNADAAEQAIINKLSTVRVVLYDDRSEVQDYLSDRHITGIKMWDSLEKDRYYYNLFQINYSLDDVAKNTSDTKAKIKERIKKYTLFLDVFNALKTRHQALNIEDLPSYLPLVDRFILTLLEDSVGLNIQENAQLKFIPATGKETIYRDILIKVGEAFLVRTNRIISNDIAIKNHTERLKTIDQDILMPGLKLLIQQYKQPVPVQGSANNPPPTGGQNPPAPPTGGQNPPPPAPLPIIPVVTPQSTYTPPSQQNQKLGFLQSEFNAFSIGGGSDGEKKVIQIIRELSLLDIDKYPFACAVLYRTLLEAAANLKISRGTPTPVASTDLNGKLTFLTNQLFISDVNKKSTIRNCLAGQIFIKMLNHYIHDLALVDVGTILQTWVTMKELIKACLA